MSNVQPISSLSKAQLIELYLRAARQRLLAKSRAQISSYYLADQQMQHCRLQLNKYSNSWLHTNVR